MFQYLDVRQVGYLDGYLFKQVHKTLTKRNQKIKNQINQNV